MINIRNKKLIVILLTFVLITTVFTGCIEKKKENNKEDSKENQEVSKLYPLTVEDGFGNKVKFEKEPMKIVSLAPSHTEILYSLDVGSKVIGNTTYCDYPKEAKKVTKIGDSQNVNLEKIIELSPDLVIQYGEGKKEVNKGIKAAGIKLLSYEPESIDEVLNVIKELGDVTNSRRKAKILTVEMGAKKDYIIGKVKDEKKVKVFYEIWHEPLMAAGPGSFVDELITLAGGENIAKDAKGKYPKFDFEQLIERNPEVYLTANDLKSKTAESIKSREGYEAIKAVKDDKVYLLDGNMLSRPGPRIVDALELVAKKLHPETFKK
ncbi:MAG: cobalamin-binding protein [Firmicutes bacterium]|nr:cobalamin-binding protein [Bacillota bacterium]